MAKTIPTIQMVLEKYPKFAAVERLRVQRPGKKTVRNMIVSIKRLCQMAGISLEEPVTVFTRRRLTMMLEFAMRNGDVFARLNADLRSQKIFTGSKGCYELRKICIDHVYQKFGAEMASSISGDDIRTMMRYYADPSQPNIGDLRIIDLL